MELLNANQGYVDSDGMKIQVCEDVIVDQMPRNGYAIEARQVFYTSTNIDLDDVSASDLECDELKARQKFETVRKVSIALAGKFWAIDKRAQKQKAAFEYALNNSDKFRIHLLNKVIPYLDVDQPRAHDFCIDKDGFECRAVQPNGFPIQVRIDFEHIDRVELSERPK